MKNGIILIPMVTLKKHAGVKVTVYLPRPLKRELDQLAIASERSISDIARDGIRQELREKSRVSPPPQKRVS
jgi:hypothetical protein